jgi:ATP-dependent Clp protease ATP-binding subunit ClpC
VILMDEIEKAHSDVFNMLLQIMEDGRLTDSHGRMVNFENTILIMTSNAGTGSKSNNIGFNNDEYSAMKDKVEDVLKSIFKPEFLNRVDENGLYLKNLIKKN